MLKRLISLRDFRYRLRYQQYLQLLVDLLYLQHITLLPLRGSRSPSVNSINLDNLLASNTIQSKQRGKKEDKQKHTKIKDKFFQLCNDHKCIKEILYKYFAEPDALITANTNKSSCCNHYNNSLQLKTPKHKIYNKKGANLDAKKNYILKRLQTWAQILVVPAAISRSTLFPIYYTITVLYTMLY